MKVLIIEDVQSMQELLKTALEKIPGVTVNGLASNIWEARLAVGRRRPDLVLLDEILPGESSLDYLAELKADQVPVVLITGVTDPKHPIPEGVLARLVKPDWKTIDTWAKQHQELILSAATSMD